LITEAENPRNETPSRGTRPARCVRPPDRARSEAAFFALQKRELEFKREQVLVE